MDTVIVMNFKRVLLAVLMILLSASFTVPSPAQEKAGGGTIELTAEERAFLSGKQLRLGIDVARPPFEYVDGKGAYTGISAEFINAAAKKLGITVVPLKEIKWNDAMEKVKVGEIDVISKVTPSAARAKFMIFTKPYTTFPSVIVTRKDRLAGGMDDLRGLKVGVNKGQIVEANLKRDHPEFSLVPYPDIETGLRALATGQCDTYVDNLGAVAYTIDTVGLTNLRIAASTPYTHDLAFGVRKDWPLLASSLDKALAGMTDQEKTEIKNRWLAIKYDAGINWRIFVPIGAILFVIIAFVLVWNRRLSKAVRERKRIQKELEENTRLLEFRSTAKAKLSQISVELQQAATFEELARTFMSQIAPLMGAAYGVFYLMDEQKQLLQAVGGYGWMEADAKSQQFRIGEGLAGQCAREKKPFSFNNSQGSNIRITWGGGHFDPRAILLQPILEQDKILGVIELGALQPFTSEQRTLLDEIMPTLALNLLITRRNLTTQELLAKGQEQIAELGKARKATLNILEDLEVSRKETEATAHKMNAMSQAVNDGMVMIDGQGKVLFWNQAAERLFGYTAAEAIGMDFHATVVSAEDQEKAHKGLSHFAATGQGVLFGATVETTAINRNGQTFPVEVNLSPFQLNDQWFAVGTVRNITERQQAEKELKERMEELERFSRLTINREAKMIQLKEEINALREQAGKEKRYKIVE
jgi:PAS domain S-box-containing protein